MYQKQEVRVRLYHKEYHNQIFGESNQDEVGEACGTYRTGQNRNATGQDRTEMQKE